MPDDPYCTESDGRPAVAERLYGVAENGTEIVELVCAFHAGDPSAEDGSTIVRGDG